MESLQPSEYLKFSIFDKIKVKVETTTEFPLDLKCTLMFTVEDQEEYNKIWAEQQNNTKEVKIEEALVVLEEMINDDV